VCWRWPGGGSYLRKLPISLRCFISIAYKGTNYHGWQIQANANTVQAEINKALKIICQAVIETVGSGRTDAGVHASEQIFHCDLPEIIALETLAHKMDSLLPKDIIVKQVQPVGDEAHARFDAVNRSYEYQIIFSKSPYGLNESYFLMQKPDFGIMNKACQLLIGEHDFTSFSKVKTEVNNFICNIKSAKWEYSTEKAVFKITANRFLRGMVRAVVGTLLDVGFNKINNDEFAGIIKAKDRGKAGQSVPAQGLYLCAVRYPSEIFK